MNPSQIIILIITTTLLTSPSNLQATEECFRCHAMPTLALQDPATGILSNYHISRKKFSQSLHGKLECNQCHKQGFAAYPHDIEEKKKTTTCLTCHQKPGPWQNMRLASIGDQYGKSVHFKSFMAKGGCFTCHDLHDADPMGENISLADKITHANKRCQECHNAIINRQDTNLAGHGWLPETRRHLQETRCVDCHAPDLGSAVHAIGPAKRAARACEECHGQNSLLRAKLYRHKMAGQLGGFWQNMLTNEAYVIGMTRYPWLDGLSFFLIAMTLCTLLGHGVLRWFLTGRNHHEDHS